jgi:hypothetical protein
MTDEVNEAAKKRLAEENKLREKSAAEYAERMKGKPTPTQEENDLAALGHTFVEHEDDGSKHETPLNERTRQLEAGKPAARYPTRTVEPNK